MAEIDPELRDKIIETHTVVKRMDEEYKEHKIVINARFREVKKELEEHKKEVKENFTIQASGIAENKTFRTKVITYASVAAGVIAFFSDPVIHGIKRLFGV